MAKRFRVTPMTDDIRARVESEVMVLLLAERDAYHSANWSDGTPIPEWFLIGRGGYGYYAEAFGMLRTLRLMGLMNFGAVNVKGNLNSWLSELGDAAIAEEKALGIDAACEKWRAIYAERHEPVRQAFKRVEKV